jgi:hypothetical protein
MSEKTFTWLLYLLMYPTWFISFGTRAMWPTLVVLLCVHCRLHVVTDPLRQP